MIKKKIYFEIGKKYYFQSSNICIFFSMWNKNFFSSSKIYRSIFFKWKNNFPIRKYRYIISIDMYCRSSAPRVNFGYSFRANFSGRDWVEKRVSHFRYQSNLDVIFRQICAVLSHVCSLHELRLFISSRFSWGDLSHLGKRVFHCRVPEKLGLDFLPDMRSIVAPLLPISISAIHFKPIFRGWMSGKSSFFCFLHQINLDVIFRQICEVLSLFCFLHKLRLFVSSRFLWSGLSHSGKQVSHHLHKNHLDMIFRQIRAVLTPLCFLCEFRLFIWSQFFWSDWAKKRVSYWHQSKLDVIFRQICEVLSLLCSPYQLRLFISSQWWLSGKASFPFSAPKQLGRDFLAGMTIDVREWKFRFPRLRKRVLLEIWMFLFFFKCKNCKRCKSGKNCKKWR